MSTQQFDLFDQPDSPRVRSAKAIEQAETEAINAMRRIVELAERSGCQPFAAATMAKLAMLANNAQRRLWQEPTIVRTEVERSRR